MIKTDSGLQNGIAMALSGGGIRATVFHLGALLRLATSGQLEAVSRLSTVSGGSLAIGLVLAKNGYRWPSSREYIDVVLPAIRAIVTCHDLQWSAIRRSLFRPWRLVMGRGTALARALETTWGIAASLSALPDTPVWFINTTNYYTGKNWRFSKHRMGDWRSGYRDAPTTPLAIALAASAGVPYVIGTTRHRLPRDNWYAEHPETRARTPMSAPAEKVIRLWDGGVYENLGAEALYKVNNGFVYPDTRFLLVCDAAQQLTEGSERVRGPIYFKQMLPRLSINVRTIDIMADQNRALRSRLLVSAMAAGEIAGSYVRIGNTASYITTQASRVLKKTINYPCENTTAVTAAALATHPTVLSKLTPEKFDQLIIHGYEATDATLGSYHPDRFPFTPKA